MYTFFVAVSGLDWRIVTDAFNWHEKEQDIRQTGMTWQGTVDEMKDSFMILLMASGEMKCSHIERVTALTVPEQRVRLY